MERAKVAQMQGLSKKLNNTICFYTPQLRRKKLTVTDDINETHEETRNGNYFYYWLRCVSGSELAISLCIEKW